MQNENKTFEIVRPVFDLRRKCANSGYVSPVPLNKNTSPKVSFTLFSGNRQKFVLSRFRFSPLNSTFLFLKNPQKETKKRPTKNKK